MAFSMAVEPDRRVTFCALASVQDSSENAPLTAAPLRNPSFPISTGAGDVKHHAGQILSITNTSTTAVVTSIPLQWACDNVPCECTFTTNVTLAPDAAVVNVEATLNNNRSDTTDYGAKGQELPATYSIGDLYR